MTLLLCLPALTEIDGRGEEKATSFDKALACAFVEVEKDRKKEKTFFFHRAGEQLVSFVQVLWPFTVVEKSSKRIVVLDCLSLLRRVFVDGSVEQCHKFNEAINGCVPSLMDKDEFFGWLEKHSAYFRDFKSMKSIEIPGCFGETKDAQEFASSIRLVGDQELPEAIPLPIAIDVDKAKSSLTELAHLKKKTKEDIGTLQETGSLVDSVETKWSIEIHGRMREEREYWNNKIEGIRPDVEEKILEYESERDRELERLLPEIESRENQVSHWEAMERRDRASVTAAERGLHNAEQELSLENSLKYEDPERDERYASILESRVNDAQQELGDQQSIHNETSHQLYRAKSLLTEKEEAYNSVKNEYNSRIRGEQMRITVLRDLREEAIASLERDLSKITVGLKGIGGNLSNLVERKRALIGEIDGIEIPLSNPHSQLRKDPYVYVPFFIGKLEKEGVSRFIVLPPSMLKMHKSVGEKLGHFFLGKIPSPSETRGQCFATLSGMLQSLLSTNRPVVREIHGKAGKANILTLAHARAKIKAGIAKLASEQVLSDKTVQKVLTALQNCARD
jgi:hypothetical protein